MDLGGSNETLIRWRCILAPPGHHDCTVRVRRRCGLFLSNYFDHLFRVFCCVGEYEINILWNEIKLARCPVIGHAEAVPASTKSKPSTVTPPPVPYRDRIILTGNGLTKARVSRQAEFVLDATDAAPGNYDFTADLTGTGDRSVNEISETWCT